MYIWVGIDVDDQLGEMREQSRVAEEEIGFSNSNFTLPLHISLKISFPVDDCRLEQTVDDILAIYRDTDAFTVPVKGLEYEGNIAWIRMDDSPTLNAFSQRINTFLLQQYGIPLHEYDLDYKFHTTLFMDNNNEKVKTAYERVKDIPLPATLFAGRFVVGISATGALGSYKIYKEIIK